MRDIYELKPYHERRSNGHGHITKYGHTMLQEDIVANLRGLQRELTEMTEFAESLTRLMSHGSFEGQFAAWKRTKGIL